MNISVIQIILIVLVALIVWRVIDRYQRSEIRKGELFVWLVFWLAVIALVVWPDAAQILAELVGIGRGVDLIVYLAILLIFYLVFRIFVRLDKIEKNITKIVRKVALDEKNEEDRSQPKK